MLFSLRNLDHLEPSPSPSTGQPRAFGESALISERRAWFGTSCRLASRSFVIGERSDFTNLPHTQNSQFSDRVDLLLVRAFRCVLSACVMCVSARTCECMLGRGGGGGRVGPPAHHGGTLVGETKIRNDYRLGHQLSCDRAVKLCWQLASVAACRWGHRRGLAVGQLISAVAAGHCVTASGRASPGVGCLKRTP
jgi:hypothetical protein